MSIIVRPLIVAIAIGVITKLILTLMPSQAQAPNINITNNNNTVYVAQSCNKYDSVQWSRYLR